MTKRMPLTIAAVFFMVFLVTALAAGNATTQISTAEFHAHMASTVKSVKMVHTHLHHVLNCLVGPKDKLFNTHFMDPCKGMGNGAINDLQVSPKLRAVLEMAIKIAVQGEHDTKFSKAHADAMKVQALLKQANVPSL